MIYDGKQNISLPAWIENPYRFATGQDLLGLRNPIQVIGNHYLSGITTASPTIRYLSIRAWIIKKYLDLSLPGSATKIREFSSRIESAMVLGHMLNNSSTIGLVGSEKALLLIKTHKNIIPLERLVTGPIAFNLYTGPSDQLKIGFTNDDGLYGLTKERGIPLANVIENVIRKTAFNQKLIKDPFIDKASVEDLVEFGQVLNINTILPDEIDLFLECILPEKPKEDNNELNRVATYTLLLKLAQDKNTMLETDDIFKKSIKPLFQQSPLFHHIQNGWLAYTIRDMVSVVHEKNFQLVLTIMEGMKDNQQITPTSVLKRLLINTSFLSDQLIELELFDQNDKIEQFLFIDFEKRINEQLVNKSTSEGLVRWETGLNELQIIDLSLRSTFQNLVLLPISWILTALRIDTNIESEYNKQLSKRGGRFELTTILEKLKKYRNENWKLLDVCADLIQATVQQHLNIAMSRMRNRSENVALLYEEDGCWIPIENKSFGAGQTASRFQETIGWLTQLGLIDKSGLTISGNKALIKGLEILKREYANYESA